MKSTESVLVWVFQDTCVEVVRGRVQRDTHDNPLVCLIGVERLPLAGRRAVRLSTGHKGIVSFVTLLERGSPRKNLSDVSTCSVYNHEVESEMKGSSNLEPPLTVCPHQDSLCHTERTNLASFHSELEYNCRGL